jgi:hypothetical protein
MNQNLIEQYVSGRMSEAQAEAFEISCLEDPELARQVEFEQRLKLGLEQVARGSTAEFVRSENSGGWRLALAASLVLAVIAGALLWKGLPGMQPHLLAAVTSQTERSGLSMRLALVRGAGTMPQIPPGRVRVEIVGLFDQASRYSVALDRLQPQQNVVTVATLYEQLPTSPITLEVMIDGDELTAGTYALHVRRQSSDEEALDFSFVKP